MTVEAGGEPVTEFGEGRYRSTLKPTEYARETNGKGEPLEQDGEAAVYKVPPPDFLFHKVKTAYPVGSMVRDENDVRSRYTEEHQRTDLYRTITAGIGGAAMPTWKEALPEEDLWALAYYVVSMRPKK